ncbi:restriction endonuclease type II-like protein [Desarmillaria tabescens]|uniref:Restriction endonuclease type II-like protein n=1 Tax=Armillaria tabescens TaxID=1929756 RepID=A0AA39N8U4_ARMTA|nr:restriction endonuclease type II-like protein [Desarmillaria tabescens]KAK0461170.1 restriction endonuclease type II-like protein [Desarmillaria tabescens]
MANSSLGTTTSASTPTPPIIVPSLGNNIILNPLQRGNPVLECIRNVGKEYGDIVADYQVGKTTGVLFLSLKYHRLHPEYIHTRIEKLGHSYNLRILLILSDIASIFSSEHRDPIREKQTCLINNITIIVAFSFEEAGHYLSTFKQFEHKSPDLIKERADKNYISMLRTSLTSISKVNKTDVETLRSSFGVWLETAQLQNLPGFGQVKARNIKNAFEKPFRNNATTSLAVLSTMKEQESDAQPTTNNSSSKGKEKAAIPTSPPVRPPRSPSPVWDIELDLTPPPSPEARWA